MEAGLFAISIAAYAAVYFAVKFLSRLLLKQDKEAVQPRVIALIAMIVAAVALCAWARLNLVNEATLSSLTDFEAGRYVGNVVGAFAIPAVVATLVVFFRIRRARRELADRERRMNRPSPQW